MQHIELTHVGLEQHVELVLIRRSRKLNFLIGELHRLACKGLEASGGTRRKRTHEALVDSVEDLIGFVLSLVLLQVNCC